MQAILNVKLQEIDQNFLNLIQELLQRNIEIVIKRNVLELEEYDQKVPLKHVMQEFAQAGYSDAFLQDVQKGFETSSVYGENYEN